MLRYLTDVGDESHFGFLTVLNQTNGMPAADCVRSRLNWGFDPSTITFQFLFSFDDVNWDHVLGYIGRQVPTVASIYLFDDPRDTVFELSYLCSRHLRAGFVGR